MQLSSSILTLSNLAVFLNLLGQTNALPAANTTERYPIPVKCGQRHLSVGDVQNAFDALRNSASPGDVYWLDCGKQAVAGSGGAQFYICNAAKSKGYFTLDDAA